MSPPTFSHIADHPYIRAVEHQLATAPESTIDGAFWGNMKDLMQSGAEKSNREAAMVMHRFKATHRPFGLYLRTFEAESYQYFSPDVVPDRDGGTVTTTYSGPSSVETKIARALSGHLPMLAVANPMQLMTSRAIIPRLQLPDKGWQQVVRNLVEFAHLIVMDCDTLAPGVLWELETIAALERRDATIVILPARGDSGRNTSLVGTAAALGAVVERRPPATKEDSRFAGLQRVAYEDEVDFDGIDQSPFFADLLAAAAAQSAEAPEFDEKLYARILNNDAVQLMDKRQYPEAFDLLTQALLVRRHIDDRAGILTTLCNLGIVCNDAGGFAQAMPYFDEALKLARELELVKDAGEIAAYKGFAHRQLGQRDEAVTWLRAGYALQAAAGSTEMESTLLQLAQVHRDAGEGDAALECYRKLRQHHRATGDSAGEMRANMRMGETYWLAERYADALTLFEEALRLARDGSDADVEETCTKIIAKLKNQIAAPDIGE